MSMLARKGFMGPSQQRMGGVAALPTMMLGALARASHALLVTCLQSACPHRV
jgi:hypothetical protein